MVHLNTTPQMTFAEPDVHNGPCQHAFIMTGSPSDVGTKLSAESAKIFGVHMTQYHDEKHKYQLIMDIELSDPAQHKEYQRQRDLYPEDTFVLANRIEDKYSIPQLGGGLRTEFIGAIYRGFRPPVMPIPPNWFPWNDDDCIAVIDHVKVTVKRIVLFRPFTHHEPAPETASYLMWGFRHRNKNGTIGQEQAHMTNLQTAELLTGPHEPPLFGLDHDHGMDLADVPEWISDDMLNAGIVVSVPCIPRKEDVPGHPHERRTKLLPKPPFDPGDIIPVMYRGIQPPRHIKVGNTYLWASTVNNSEELQSMVENMSFIMSDMPHKYWKTRGS